MFSQSLHASLYCNASPFGNSEVLNPRAKVQSQRRRKRRDWTRKKRRTSTGIPCAELAERTTVQMSSGSAVTYAKDGSMVSV